MEILSTMSSNQMPRIPATSAFGRGCVKTHRADAPSNIDLSERSVFDYFSLRKGKRTPETETALRFYTASVVNRPSAGINVKLLSTDKGVIHGYRNEIRRRAIPWNKGNLLGQKPPLKLKEIWAIRIRLQLDHRTRDLALFNLAVDSKLRGFDLVALRVHDVVKGRSHGLTSDCHAEENTATSAIRDHRANEGWSSRMDRRRTS